MHKALQICFLTQSAEKTFTHDNSQLGAVCVCSQIKASSCLPQLVPHNDFFATQPACINLKDAHWCCSSLFDHAPDKASMEDVSIST